MPLRASHNLTSLVVLDVKPVTGWVRAVPLPLPFFGFVDSGAAGFSGCAEDGEEDLHEGVVGVVVACPFAVDDGGEGGEVGAFFEGEGHFGGF